MEKGFKVLLYSTIAAIIGLLIFSGIVLFKTSADEKNIFNGIYINNINIGGKTQAGAIAILQDKLNKPIENKKIYLKSENFTYDIIYKTIDAHYDIETAVKKAFEYGKTGNIISKTKNRLKLEKGKIEIPVEFVFNNEKIGQIAKEISQKLDKEPKDGGITFDGNKFSLTKDIKGQKVNQEKLVKMIADATDVNIKVTSVEIPIEITQAKITEELLSKINTKTSSFTTTFKPSDINRTQNLKIAVNQTNGTLIMPGEIFSMNKTLGPRGVKEGYKEAPVIINGTITPGLAGGICQVTSTLYNAALLCNLDIVERRQHGVAVSYVGIGRDATISGDAIDFKFRNNHKSPIYIYAYMGKSSLTISLYGANEHPGQYVEIKTEIIERIKADIEYIYDPSLNEGIKITEEKPITGIKSKTYKKLYQDGKLVKEYKLSEDYYKPVKGKIRIGTNPISSEIIPNTSNTDTSQNTETATDSTDTSSSSGN